MNRVASTFKKWTPLVLCLALAGCQPEGEIVSYETPRTTEPRQPAADVAVLEAQLDYTLVAIVRQDEKAWFFKLPAAAGSANRQRAAFLDFLSGVTLAKSADVPPTWKLPEGWQEKGPSQMRVATLIVPDEAGSLEIAVSSLPYSGDWDGFLLMNVNRWLRQLQQSELSSEVVGKFVREIGIQNGTATFLELSGTRPRQQSMNPHAGMPPVVRPPATPAPAEQPKTGLSYDTPEGWAPGRMSTMRKAAFDITEGEAKAEVTVITFSADAGPQITDLKANVMRWARQAGLVDKSSDEIMKLVKPITVGGAQGSYVELIGPDQAMLSAMLVQDGKVWFFKIFGSGTLVQEQKTKFKAFLDSITFE